MTLVRDAHESLTFFKPRSVAEIFFRPKFRSGCFWNLGCSLPSWAVHFPFSTPSAALTDRVRLSIAQAILVLFAAYFRILTQISFHIYYGFCRFKRFVLFPHARRSPTWIFEAFGKVFLSPKAVMLGRQIGRPVVIFLSIYISRTFTAGSCT